MIVCVFLKYFNEKPKKKIVLKNLCMQKETFICEIYTEINFVLNKILSYHLEKEV